MTQMDDLEAIATQTEGVEQSAATVLATIHQELVDALAANDPARIQAVVDQLGASTSSLSAAIAANPDPNAPPATA